MEEISKTCHEKLFWCLIYDKILIKFYDLLQQQPSQMLKPSAPGTDTASEGEAQPQQNLEGMQYDEAKTYIMLEFELEKPVVPKRAPEELASR